MEVRIEKLYRYYPYIVAVAIAPVARAAYVIAF